MKKIENKFLLPTKFCDSDNEKIIKLAKEITKDCSFEREKAIRLFNFVRNNFKYAFGPWNFKASEVIYLKTGMCTTKSELLVALLRAINIPAGFKVVKIKAKQVFGKFAIFSFITNQISEISIHIYVSVFLDGKWIDVDPSLDEALIRGLIFVGYDRSMLDKWDGKKDMMNFFEPDELIENGNLVESIDEYHLKKRKVNKNLFIFFSNFIMNYYRFLGLLLKIKK